MKINKRDPGHWLLLMQQGIYTLVSSVARFFLPTPKKPVVVLYGHQLSGNLQALYCEWQSHFRDQFDCHFLSLDPGYSQQLRDQGVHVLQCSKLQDMVLVGRCKAIITDHGLHALHPFLSLTNILFIDVWHGIPFKGFVPEDFRVQQRYDEIWVSSPLLKEIYQTKFGFRPNIVKDLGYARADKLFLRQPPDPSLREKAAIPAGKKVVLYAPTWQQDDNGRELFPFGESQDSFIRRLSETCDQNNTVLIIRSHLNASISSQHFENVRYCSMKEFPDAEGLLSLTDVLICDWSSIAFDFLALDRPTIFLNVAPPFKNGFSLSGEYRFGRIAESMSNLTDSLDSYLKDAEHYGQIYAKNHQVITAAVYGSNTHGDSSNQQWNHLAEKIRDSND